MLCDLDSLLEKFESDRSVANQRSILAKIQKGLIVAQDLGDEKLAHAQTIADIIESRTRALESSAENLDFDRDDESNEREVDSRENGKNADEGRGGGSASGEGGRGGDRTGAAKSSAKASKHKAQEDSKEKSSGMLKKN